MNFRNRVHVSDEGCGAGVSPTTFVLGSVILCVVDFNTNYSSTTIIAFDDAALPLSLYPGTCVIFFALKINGVCFKSFLATSFFLAINLSVPI